MVGAKSERQMIIVRSLVESDLGLFAAHRLGATSKQRALNINADIVRRLVSKEAFDAGGVSLRCVCSYTDTLVQGTRRLGKSGKNWRLGGQKIEGKVFAELDCRDLALIRTRPQNDGTHPITIVFVSKIKNRVVHAGLVAILEKSFDRSMVAIETGDPRFDDLALHCPVLPWNGPKSYSPVSPYAGKTARRPPPYLQVGLTQGWQQELNFRT